jgi:DNA polymerase-3 subunit epsilon
MAREIVLDTETTGIDPRQGHRLIEVGCLELEDLMPTGRTFHRFINPERLIDPDAIRVHGITDDKVRDAPVFRLVAEELLAFVGDAPLIAHNAAFDRGFINHELGLCGLGELPEPRWIDTLKLAQARFPGMANSLDALCRRFKISLVERTLHGALIDARLLADVYLELKGGRERALDLGAGLTGRARTAAGEGAATGAGHGPRPRPLAARVSDAEAARHLAFVQAQLKDLSLWTANGLEIRAEVRAEAEAST